MSDKENEESDKAQKKNKFEKQVQTQKHHGQQRIYAKRLPR